MFATADPDAEQPNAISAVKALQIASAQGQRIYQITQENMSTALANINHDQETMDEIEASLNAGKEVITHTDAVSVPGWSGAGYIIIDPDTGAGAYKISGGANGGYLIGFSLAVSATILILAALPALSNLLTAETAILAIGLAAGQFVAMVGFYHVFNSISEEAGACFLGGVVAGITAALMASGVAGAAFSWIGFILSQAGLVGSPASDCFA
jgi:heme/copper-type cytochrome/quinol oxidase subunit 4